MIVMGEEVLFQSGTTYLKIENKSLRGERTWQREESKHKGAEHRMRSRNGKANVARTDCAGQEWKGVTSKRVKGKIL